MPNIGPNAATSLSIDPQAGAARGAQPSYPILELRQYTLHEGKRDILISLFEREFIESQEAEGMKVIGTFIDLDRPDRFVWIRGFRDMESRLQGLSRFYDGPVWRAHREDANATMIDSDNVLLLNAPDPSAEFDLPDTRPMLGEPRASGVLAAHIHYIDVAQGEAANLFETRVKPALWSAGIDLLGWFTTSDQANNFPRLPVRDGERTLVWFAAFEDELKLGASKAAIDAALAPLEPHLARQTEVLRLKPTSRSLIRGMRSSASEHDFDFLHGQWTVTHRRLKERGASSKDWTEIKGGAETRPLLGGLCNIEEHRIEGQDFSGIALRCFDKDDKRWSIYWVSERDGQLQPPVVGGFKGAIGTFEGEDVDNGRPVRVRFLWRKNGPRSASWEQAFSYDSGVNWETNWTMEFERSVDA